MEEPIVDNGFAKGVEADHSKLVSKEGNLSDLVQPAIVVEGDGRLETLLQELDTGQVNNKADKQEPESATEKQRFTLETDTSTLKTGEEEEGRDESEENDSDVDQKDNTMEETALSVHISPDDRALFDDGTNGGDQATESPETTEDVESIRAHSMLSEGSIDEAKEDTEEEEMVYERKSDLHCALCGEFCTDGRLLRCLHTFCLQCLESKMKETFKIILCPLCRCRTHKPREGLQALKKNQLISNLIEAQSALRMDKDCVVCKLVGEDSVSVARCLDCGDLLCQDCSSKHTYSRQTAKHTVVSIETEAAETATYLPTNRIVHCQTHKDEEVKFYCNKCGMGVCRDCVLLGHSSHTCVGINDAYEKVSDHIRKCVTQLKEKSEQLKDDDYEKDLSIVEVEEKKQIKYLEDAKADIIKAVERDFNNCMRQLEKEFNKKREYCLLRKNFVEKNKQVTNCLEENTNFILKWGSAVEVIAMEKVLDEAYSGHTKNIKAVFPTVQKSRSLPRVMINKENLKVIGNLTWCNIVKPHHTKDPQQTGTSQKTDQSKSAMENQSRARKSTQRNVPLKGNVSNNAVRAVHANTRRGQHNQDHGMPLRSSQQQVPGPGLPPMGRGKYLQSCTAGSLLGEYHANLKNTGSGSQGFGFQHPQSASMTTRSNDYGQTHQFQPAGNGYKFQSSSLGSSGGGYTSASKTKQNLNGPDNYAPQIASRRRRHSSKEGNVQSNFPHMDKLVSSVGKEHIRLRLQTSVKISVLLEQFEPEVTGIAFTSHQAFAVSDGRNKRVKLFDIGGKFLTVVDDVDPMAMTVCEDHLVWNSNFSDIMIYSLARMNKLDCRIFNMHSCHPVATFKGEKLLVANVQGSTVEAYQVEGNSYKWIHSLQPVDGHGQPLKNVSQIAANAKDQLALVDKALRKVIVTNFDGRFIGEYSSNGWEPGGICVDHHDNIFVTDRGRNKLIALTGDGQFIQEWKTMVDLPSAVACNSKGQVIVAGRGNNISVYQYE